MVDIKTKINRLVQEKAKLQEDYQKAIFFKGKSLNSMVEYDDAMTLLAQEIMRIEQTPLGTSPNTLNTP